MDSELKLVPAPDKAGIVEVRCAVRFPLTLPIRVITEGGEYEATTENISASGVLFTLEEELGVTCPVQFLLKMPAAILGTQEDVVLHCFGRVVRSYESADQFHAAAVIDDYRFSQ